MSASHSSRIERGQLTSASIGLEKARLLGSLEHLNDLAGFAGAMAALDSVRASFAAAHQDDASREGWIA